LSARSTQSSPADGTPAPRTARGAGEPAEPPQHAGVPQHAAVPQHAGVSATPAARELIERLTAEHGPLTFHQSGGCCDGSSPMCLLAGELPAGRYDVMLGELAGAPFYIDAELYRRWGRPEFVIDVSEGAGEGFSLEGSHGVHFVARSGPAAAV